MPHHPGKCGRLHGHSYRFEVAIEGPLQSAGPAQGMVVDFDEVAAVVKATIVERLDHASLNDLIPNPTAENIARWIWNELVAHLAGLVEIVVWETRTACAIVRAGDAGRAAT